MDVMSTRQVRDLLVQEAVDAGVPSDWEEYFQSEYSVHHLVSGGFLLRIIPVILETHQYLTSSLEATDVYGQTRDGRTWQGFFLPRHHPSPICSITDDLHSFFLPMPDGQWQVLGYHAYHELGCVAVAA